MNETVGRRDGLLADVLSVGFTHPGGQGTETRAGQILEITRVSSALYSSRVLYSTSTRTYYRYSYYLEYFMRPATSPGEGQARAKSKNDLT